MASYKTKCLILTAPPAWGKTSLLLKYFKENDDTLFIYISPLRALAEEFYKRVQEEVSAIYVTSTSLREKNILNGKRVLVSTAENIHDDTLMLCLSSKRKIIVVLDEVHLFFIWGIDFRPRLIELLYLIGQFDIPILGLTATWSKSAEILSNEILGTHYLFEQLNIGNFRFLNRPKEISVYPNFLKNTLKSHFTYKLKYSEGRILYFCKTRREVDFWLNYCFRNKICALGCVGGKGQDFIEQLKKTPHVKCIFSTTALSHGVNLPSFQDIFLSYLVECPTFWLQMASRGGRNGEDFNLHSVGSHQKQTREKLFSILICFKNCLFIFLKRSTMM